MLIVMFCFNGFTQIINKNCQDGKIYFKFNDNAPFQFSEKSGIVDIGSIAFLKNIDEQFGITKVSRPFKNTSDLKLQRIFQVEFSNYNAVNELIAALSNIEILEYAEKVPLFYTTYVPNDTYYPLTGGAFLSCNGNWHLDKISAEQAWDISKGNGNIKVAVLDNGIWSDHPDLINKIVDKIDLADGDLITTPPTADLTWSHGTHTSGLIAAESDNNLGVASIGYNISLIAVKVGRDSDGGLVAGFEGITWAADHDADVISMSWGSAQGGVTGQYVINYAFNKGVVLVAAAGNDGTNAILYPASYDNVIAVASTDESDAKSSFSQYGAKIDVCAPGGFEAGGFFSVLSTTYSDASFLGAGLFGVSGKYDVMQGTSMSCPIVAGLCGLMLSVDSNLTPTKLEEYLKATCDNIDAQNSAYLGQIGSGRINAFKALQMVQDSMAALVADFIATDGTALAVNGNTDFQDLSIGAITSWQWSFPGGFPSSSISQNPSNITYSLPGSYSVSLTVTDTAGNTSTEIKPNLIVVTASANSAWIVQVSGFATQYRGIQDICIVDSNVVWASAFDGSGAGVYLQEYTKTTDGGYTWTPDTIAGVLSHGIGNISAISNMKAWATLYNTTAAAGGKIMHTSDGGATWSHQPTATFTGTAGFPNAIHLFDANNGFCMGDPNGGYFEIYTTVDGGTTWTRVPQANIPANQSGEMGWTGIYDAKGDTVWFGTNKGRIYKSIDKGINWTVTSTGAADCSKISFSDQLNGVMEYKVVDQATGGFSTFVLKKTTDGGATWTTIPNALNMFKSDISAVPQRPGFYVSIGGSYAVGLHGSSYSIDYGATWTLLDTVQYTAVKFISPTVGWAGGFNLNSSSEGIYKWANPTIPSSLNELYENSVYNVYPNPANNVLNIDFSSDNKDIVTIKIIDIIGRVVFQLNDKKSTSVYHRQISLNSIEKGVYFAIIESNGKIYSQKIVIQ